MLRVNSYPVLSVPGLVNEINLTDTAYSDLSVVYLDKAHAPVKHNLVWVTIDDPEGGNMLERYMYVEQVLYEDYADTIARDSEGNPILDEDDNPILESRRNTPGWVKVLLREHKHVLTQYKSLDHFNIPQLLPYAALDVYGLDSFQPYNYMDWDAIRNYLSAIGCTLSFQEGDEVPIVPVNLYWQNLQLADCLDDLLFSFSCRVIEQAGDYPGAAIKELNLRDPDVIDNLPNITNLVWQRRRFVDLPNDIIYDTILWPEDPEEYRTQQIDRIDPVFPTANTRDFDYAGRQPSPSINDMVSFPCNKVIVGGEYTAIRDYIKSTAINFNYYYSFTTRRLPQTFLTDYDWSTVQYLFTDSSYSIKVEHLPRRFSRAEPNYNPARNETYVGRITSISPSDVTLTDIRNLTFPNRGNPLRQTISLPFSDIHEDNVGKDLTFKVENGTLVAVSTSSLYSPVSDGEGIIPMFNGMTLLSVKHEIVTLNPECTNASISFGLDPVYDYKYHSHEFNPLATTPNEVVYQVNYNSHAFWVFDRPAYLPWMKVRFEMIPSVSDIIDYLSTLPSFTTIGNEYIDACAKYWVDSYKYVNIYFNFSLNPTHLDWRYQGTQPSNTYPTSINLTEYAKVMSPDVDSRWFTGLGGQVIEGSSAFPLVFNDTGFTAPGTSTSIPTRGNVGLNYTTILHDLAVRYINNHLYTFPAYIHIAVEQ